MPVISSLFTLQIKSSTRLAALLGLFFAAGTLASAFAQDGDATLPNIVQPGAPGEPTHTLSRSTRAELPPTSPKDVSFMQGMIMHHAQAVEMTSLIEGRSTNENVRRLAGRISKSQSDEIRFMKRWLELRGEPISMQMASMPGMDMSSHLMPGMLTRAQMQALKNAVGPEFDRLFLNGMIQHHTGALVMVKSLFNSAGAGQDAEIFSFASDVDSGQRAEIKIMETILASLP